MESALFLLLQEDEEEEGWKGVTESERREGEEI
jgi:hypothetical protein